MLLRLLGERFAYAEAYADIFPLENQDLISKSGAAPISRLVDKTSTYAEAYAANCLKHILYFISEGVCLREAYAARLSA